MADASKAVPSKAEAQRDGSAAETKADEARQALAAAAAEASRLEEVSGTEGVGEAEDTQAEEVVKAGARSAEVPVAEACELFVELLQGRPMTNEEHELRKVALVMTWQYNQKTEADTSETIACMRNAPPQQVKHTGDSSQDCRGR